MGLKSYSELKKLDLSKYIKKRDNADYINSCNWLLWIFK